MRGLIALAVMAAQPESIPERLPPIERCSAEAGFDAFRSQLKHIVATKDEPALLSLLSEDVEVNFGGDRGPALFAANWNFDSPGESHVWAELKDALAFGCAPSGDALVSPSLIAQFPMELDAFETLVARPGAILRTAPHDGAPAIASLDWHVLSVTESVDVAPWSGVTMSDGRKGYVRGDQMRSPLDYRIVFEKHGDRWMITAFVAGD